MPLYVLTTEQDSAPQSFLPANGSAAQTFDTTLADLLGGGLSLIGFANVGGTVLPDDTQVITSPQELTLQADDTFPTILIVAFIPVELRPTAPADDVQFTVELQIDDAPPLDGVRNMRLAQVDAPGNVLGTLTAVWTYQIGDDVPHTYRLKGSSNNGTTTAVLGTDALPFPTGPGQFLILGNASHVTLLP